MGEKTLGAVGRVVFKSNSAQAVAFKMPRLLGKFMTACGV